MDDSLGFTYRNSYVVWGMLMIKEFTDVFTESEILFYGGILLMALAVLLACIFIAIFTITGRRIKRKLYEEYGKCLK